MFRIGQVGVLLCAGLLVAGCASQPKTAPEQKLVGYLGDYSKLESVKGDKGEEVRRWISPKVKPGDYTKLIVDPVVYHPAPQATKQVTVETLNQIRAYTDEALRRELSKSYMLVTQVGPGVARVRIALTGITTEAEGLKPYELIPIAAIAAGAMAAAGQRDRKAFLLVEGEVTDSVTNERLAIGIRKVPGKKMLENDTQQVTLELMRPIIDGKAENARVMFDRVLK